MHTCSHTLSVRTRVCAHDADFTVLPFLQPMSTTIYVYPSAWNTQMEMCHTCRWESDSCLKAWALCRFIYCFNDAVCFIFMYFVRNDEIKTVNWKKKKKKYQVCQGCTKLKSAWGLNFNINFRPDFHAIFMLSGKAQNVHFILSNSYIGLKMRTVFFLTTLKWIRNYLLMIIMNNDSY